MRQMGLVAVVAILARSPAAAATGPADCARGADLETRVHCWTALGADPEAAARARPGLLAELARDPGADETRLAVALLTADEEAAEAESLYRAAIDGFVRARAVEAELLARDRYADFLYHQFRNPEAQTQLEAGLAAASAAGRAIAQARLFLGAYLVRSGEDFGRAEILFGLVRDEIETAGTARQHAILYDGMAEVRRLEGRHDEALELLDELRAAARELGDEDLEGEVLNRAVAWEVERMELAHDLRPEALRPRALAALQWATERGREATRVEALINLADLSSSAEAVPLYRQCMERAQAIHDLRDYVTCRVDAALELRTTRPDEAVREVEAVKAMLAQTIPWPIPKVESSLIALYWETGPRDKALSVSLDLLDTFERFRDSQTDTRALAEAFTNLAGDAFYWVSGVLLQQKLVSPRAEQPSPADIALAFSIMERLRARQLFDSLRQAGAAPAIPADHPLQRALNEAREAIAAAQRELLASVSVPAERERIARRIEGLEARELDLRVALARENPAYRRFRPPTLASPDALAAALGPRRALFAYQLANDQNVWGYENGGSWLTVVTASGARVHRLAERWRIEPMVQLYVGLVQGRGEPQAVAAARLYRELVADGVAALPAGIDELVIVPDGALMQLPFGALQGAPDQPRLAERYAISVAPSATLWLQWETSAAPAPRDGGALVLADPEFVGAGRSAGSGGADARSWSSFGARPLGRLPHARVEGRALVKLAGGASRLLIGADASEQLVKHADLTGVGVVHFATHALVDLQWPDRSGLLLAPGAAGEDGLLQPEEIAQLPLEHRLVVLSACETAGGLSVRGEGVLGLARAFLQAGAPAVVATLWRVRDEEMAPLMASVYRHLARGETAAEAVAAATREAIRAGADPASWASLVVLGDGDLRPLPARPRRPAAARSYAPAVVAALLLLLSLAGAGALWRRRRHRDRAPQPAARP